MRLLFLLRCFSCVLLHFLRAWEDLPRYARQIFHIYERVADVLQVAVDSAEVPRPDGTDEHFEAEMQSLRHDETAARQAAEERLERARRSREEGPPGPEIEERWRMGREDKAPAASMLE